MFWPPCAIALFSTLLPWEGPAVARFPVVFPLQRAGPPFPEPALSARLQHCSAPAVLVVAPGLDFPVERLFSGGRQALVRTGGSRRPRAPARSLLAWVRLGIFYIFDNPGILLDALLSGVRPAPRIGDGRGRGLDSPRHTRADGACRHRGLSHLCDPSLCEKRSDSRGHFHGALAPSNAYTLSLGHMQDLTLNSFAYLRLP